MHRQFRQAVRLLLLSTLIIGVHVHAVDLIHIAAGPQEIAAGHLRLPDPAQASIASRSMMLPITLEAGADGSWQWRSDIAIDDPTEVKLAVISPFTADWEWTIHAAGATPLRVTPKFGPGLANPEDASIAVGNRRFPAKIVAIEHGKAGRWSVQLQASHKPSHSGPDGYLLVSSRSPYRLQSQLLHYRLLLGQEIGFSAQLSLNNNSASKRIEAAGKMTRAQLRLHFPDGSLQTLEMRDDGRGQRQRRPL